MMTKSYRHFGFAIIAVICALFLVGCSGSKMNFQNMAASQNLTPGPTTVNPVRSPAPIPTPIATPFSTPVPVCTPTPSPTPMPSPASTPCSTCGVFYTAPQPVAADGNYVIESTPSAWGKGQVNIYNNQTGILVLEATFYADPDDSLDYGWSVAISSEIATAVVGSPINNGTYQPNPSGVGSVYIYERNSNGSWSKTSRLVAPQNLYLTDWNFGTQVALNSYYLAVSNDTDTLYFYTRNADGSYNYSSDLTALQLHLPDDGGYQSLVFSSDRLLFPSEQGLGALQICVAHFVQNIWQLETCMTGPNNVWDSFGNSFAINENIIAIGDNWSEASNVAFAGVVYIYTFNGSTWVQMQILQETTPNEQDYFGSTVLFSQNQLIITSAGNQNLDAQNIYHSGTLSQWTSTQKGFVLNNTELGPIRNYQEEIAYDFGYSSQILGSQLVTPQNCQGRTPSQITCNATFSLLDVPMALGN